MNDIVITEALLTDVDTIQKWGVNNRDLLASEHGDFYSKKDLKEWILHQHKDVLLAARHERKLVGICLTTVMFGWAISDVLYVVPEYRGQGIGKKLIDKTIEKLKEKDIGYLALLANVDNKTGFGFYERIGFKEGYTFKWLFKRFSLKK